MAVCLNAVVDSWQTLVSWCTSLTFIQDWPLCVMIGSVMLKEAMRMLILFTLQIIRQDCTVHNNCYLITNSLTSYHGENVRF